MFLHARLRRHVSVLRGTALGRRTISGVSLAMTNAKARSFLHNRLQILNLSMLNKLKERERVAHGKPAKLLDLSMSTTFTQYEPESTSSQPSRNGAGSGSRLGEPDRCAGNDAFLDLTDRENDEFQYLL